MNFITQTRHLFFLTIAGGGNLEQQQVTKVSVIEQILHMIHENPKYENLLDDFFVLHKNFVQQRATPVKFLCSLLLSDAIQSKIISPL